MQQEIPGFDILYIHDVPPGQILNKDTAKDYPLIECGTWISKDRNWMIQKCVRQANGIDYFKNTDYLELIPNTQDMRMDFYSKRSSFIGDAAGIVLFLKTEYPNFAYGTPARTLS